MMQLDYNTFFGQRCLDYKPNHFILAKTPINKTTQLWIYNKLRGRFSLCVVTGTDRLIDPVIVPAFENPQEAVFYELTWS